MFILLLNRGLFSPDSCYYQAERGLSTTKINKNKVLKTFTGHQYIGLPNTNNGLEGIFADIKTKLRVHSGLCKDNRKKLIDEYLSRHY